MTRELVPGVLVFLPNGTPAPDIPFTLWTDQASGTQITDVTAPDGIGTYVLKTDSSGQLLPFRGPDGYRGLYFADTGSGIRYMLMSSSVQEWLVQQVIAILANSGGGGLPSGTTLQDIPDGTNRLALAPGERLALSNIPGSYLTLGTTATTAAPGNKTFTAAQVGAVANLGGFAGIVSRTAGQGLPSPSELALLPAGTYIAVDQA